MHIHGQIRLSFSSEQWLSIDFRNRLIQEDVLSETELFSAPLPVHDKKRLKNNMRR